jgi:hypothetical protein
MMGRIDQLKARDGIADQTQTIDKAQAIRVEVMGQGRFMHDGADDKVSQ